jgi:hypothetical protein
VPPLLVAGHVLVADLPGRGQALGHCRVAGTAKLTGQPSIRPTAASTTPSACGSAAGSSQSRSNAAFKLEAASSGTPACSASTAVPSASPHPCWRANTPTTLRSAWPIRLMVSSTLPAPHSGLESSAARSLPPATRPVSCPYNPTVRPTSRRSSWWAISRARKPTSVVFENGAWAWSMQSTTSCQRRSITIASSTSSSEAPV